MGTRFTARCLWSVPRIVRSLVFLLVPVACAAAAAAAAPATAPATAPAFDDPPGVVGRLGGWRNLVVEGSVTFPADDVAKALAADLEVEHAAAPSAPLEPYLQTLRRRAVDGYRNRGFRGTTADVRLDRPAGKIVVRVVEGPRFRRGLIRVDGAKTVPVDALVRRLATPRLQRVATSEIEGDDEATRVRVRTDERYWDQPDRTDWKVGDPMPFTAAAITSLASNVRTALAELGYYRARFLLDTPLTPPADAGQAGTAPLVIELVDEGPRATVGAVEVRGLTRAKPEAVLAIAGLRVGGGADLWSLWAAVERLRESARFQWQSINLTVDARTGAAAVVVNVIEMNGLPPAGEPLGEADAAVQRMGAWLAGLGRGDDDLFVDLTWRDRPDEAVRATAALGFTRGFAARVAWETRPSNLVIAATTNPTSRPAALVQAATAPVDLTGPVVRVVDLAVAVVDGSLAVWCPTDGTWARQDLPTAQLLVPISAGTGTNPDGSPGWYFNVGFGFVVKGKTPELLRTLVGIAPAALANFASQPGWTRTVADGVLTVAGPAGTIRADAATGRLIEARSAAGATDLVFVARPERGAVKRLAAEWAATLVPPGTPPSPAGGFAVALRSVALRWLAPPDVDPATYRRAAAALAAVASPEALDPIARPFVDKFAEPQPDDYYSIPFEPERLPPARPAPFGDVALLVLEPFGELFPRGSWPWVLTRQAMLDVAGRGQDAPREFARAARATGIGPVGCWLAAEWARDKVPDLSRDMARLGLERLDAAWVTKDVAALADPASPAGQLLRHLATTLGAMPPDQVEHLAAVLAPEHATALRTAAAELRARRGEPIDAALAATAAKLWSGGVQRPIEARLRALAAP